MPGIQCEDELVQNIHNPVFNPIQDGGWPKSPPPPTSFSSVTSGNVKISPRNILTFSFNTFATLV